MHERTNYKGYALSRTRTALESYTLYMSASDEDSRDAIVPHLLIGFSCEIAGCLAGLDLYNF